MASEFNWRNHWYPILFVADLPAEKPCAFLLYGEPYVLFADTEGRLFCTLDRCPHRAARLSDGRMVEGKLECRYHGWQFDGSGQCAHIPQYPKDKPIPAPACLKPCPIAQAQGMLWFWPGPSDLADSAAIPTVSNLDREDVFHVDYAIDLPYDQTYLIENVIDVAHIHIIHDGIRGGGKRELAAPLQFSVLENSADGIKSLFRSMGSGNEQEMTRLNSGFVEFNAPNLIHYTSSYQNPALVSGLALYSMPMAPGRCRLLYRKYSNFYAWRERIKPRWLEHWTQNTILKQDMALIIGQYAEIERSKEQLKDLWLPLKTSDTLVIQYRKWLDIHAAETPFYRGYASCKQSGQENSQPTPPQDVFSLHTRQCKSCHSALQKVKITQSLLVTLLIVLVPSFGLLESQAWLWGSSIIYGTAVTLLWALQKIRRQFE